ncbi:MAG: hypothetical protein ACOCV3_04795 [Halanaerobiales bacterium]
MFEYGNLRYLDKKGWIFLVEGEMKELKADGYIEGFNEVGLEGWELVVYDPDAGYLFKRKLE